MRKKGITTNQTMAILLTIAGIAIGLWLGSLVLYHTTEADPGMRLIGARIMVNTDNTVTLKFETISDNVPADEWKYRAQSGETEVVPWTSGTVPLTPENEVKLPACTEAVNEGELNVGDSISIKIQKGGTTTINTYLDSA